MLVCIDVVAYTYVSSYITVVLEAQQVRMLHVTAMICYTNVDQRLAFSVQEDNAEFSLQKCESSTCPHLVKMSIIQRRWYQ